MPRREGGRGTEVSSLPGGQNLGENCQTSSISKRNFTDLLTFPTSRMGEDSGFQIGKSDNIMRDEVKFAKFVGRMRKKFSYLFTDFLKTQLGPQGCRHSQRV